MHVVERAMRYFILLNAFFWGVASAMVHGAGAVAGLRYDG